MKNEKLKSKRIKDLALHLNTINLLEELSTLTKSILSIK